MRKVVLSVPRSGYNLTRYCIEYLTQLPTPGGKKRLIKKRLNKNNRPFYHVHGVKAAQHIGGSKKGKLIVIYRNPLEILFRLESKKNTVEREIYGRLHKGKVTKKNVKSLINYYIKIFNFYESWKGDKLLIKYEDLLDSFDPIKKIIDLFELDILKDMDEFIKDELFHREEALKLGNHSITKGNNKFYYQYNNGNDKLKFFMIDKIKKHKKIWETYLSEYFKNSKEDIKKPSEEGFIDR